MHMRRVFSQPASLFTYTLYLVHTFEYLRLAYGVWFNRIFYMKIAVVQAIRIAYWVLLGSAYIIYNQPTEKNNIDRHTDTIQYN